jgi:hypothetical protein
LILNGDALGQNPSEREAGDVYCESGEEQTIAEESDGFALCSERDEEHDVCGEVEGVTEDEVVSTVVELLGFGAPGRGLVFGID